MTSKKQQKTVPKETTQKGTKKQKTSESSASTRYLERIANTSTKSLKISPGSDSSSRSSYGLKDIPSVASRFIEEDMMAFNATFKPADEYGSVIPDVEGKKYENNLSEPILII